MAPFRFLRILLLIANLGSLGRPAWSQGVLVEWRQEGGDRDDAAFAQAAFGPVTGWMDEQGLSMALDAVRATDRFRAVEGHLEPVPGGLRAVLRLDPWPALRRIEWAGDALPRGLRKALLAGVHPGMRPGTRRLEAWRQRGEERLREAGYPLARLEMARNGQDVLVVRPQRGPQCIVRRVEVAGDPGPYRVSQVVQWARIKPGRTVWTPRTKEEVMGRLRKGFIKDHRYEGKAEAQLDPEGLLRLTIHPGPRVKLECRGGGLSSRRARERLPLARAGRYTPQLLEEGERLLVRNLREEGYLDAQVTHRREVTQGSPAQPREVQVTYLLAPGSRTRIRELRFEGNLTQPELVLQRAAALPKGLFSCHAGPLATPALLNAVQARVKAYYLSLGFMKVRVGRRLQVRDGSTCLVLEVREGDPFTLSAMVLKLPLRRFPDALGVAEGMASALGKIPARLEAPPEDPRASTASFRLIPAQAEPLVKHRLGAVLLELRRRLRARGMAHPPIRTELDFLGSSVTVQFEVADQPLARVRRLVVQGSDRTRAKAVLREAALHPGLPLDEAGLSLAQVRINALEAFNSVDFSVLADAGQTWEPGDLKLNLQERFPWSFSSSFGYEQSQGYHVGLGLKRSNLGGMGRSLDLGMRAGDGTLNSRPLRRLFPTGDYNRSVDSYGLTYLDPAFSSGVPWLPAGGQFSSTAAYIQENRSTYLLRRRRVLQSMAWRPSPRWQFQAGHRWERVELASALPGISLEELKVALRTPTRSIFSAPFFQAARDTRDNPLDPSRGSYSSLRFEFANQLFGTTPGNSFVKLEARQQWNWALGRGAGVLALGLRVGLARPTESGSQELPFSEQFLAGGPLSHRGVMPDGLGPLRLVPVLRPPEAQVVEGQPRFEQVPTGGQALAIASLEYRFPLSGRSVWGEVFLDSGQVYRRLRHRTPQECRNEALEERATGVSQPPIPEFPRWRTALGVGLIFKSPIPIKLEYAVDVQRVLRKPMDAFERDTRARNLWLSLGYQF